MLSLSQRLAIELLRQWQSEGIRHVATQHLIDAQGWCTVCGEHETEFRRSMGPTDTIEFVEFALITYTVE